MDISQTESIEIIEQSQINEARRKVVSYAREHGLSEKSRDRLAIVCTELGTNLIKHTPHGGQLLLQAVIEEDREGIELYALDNGNGMDTNICMVDGFSSTGTMGTGLGAIARLTDDFHIHATTGKGTVIQTRIWDPARSNDSADQQLPEFANPRRAKYSFGGLNIPKKGEVISGDKWNVVQKGDYLNVLLVDGLGHGIEASDASTLAIKRFKENLNLPPAALMKLLHQSLRGSRGAVAAVARINLVKDTLDYCGLGNVAGIIYLPTERKHLVSMNGTVGYEARKFMEFNLPFPKESILVMHSDGLSSKTFSAMDDVFEKEAALIAGWLVQQHAKNNDDASVIVVRPRMLRT